MDVEKIVKVGVLLGPGVSVPECLECCDIDGRGFWVFWRTCVRPRAVANDAMSPHVLYCWRDSVNKLQG